MRYCSSKRLVHPYRELNAVHEEERSLDSRSSEFVNQAGGYERLTLSRQRMAICTSPRSDHTPSRAQSGSSRRDRGFKAYLLPMEFLYTLIQSPRYHADRGVVGFIVIFVVLMVIAVAVSCAGSLRRLSEGPPEIPSQQQLSLILSLTEQVGSTSHPPS